MIFKSYILEQNLETIDKYKIILFYGENTGLIREFKEKILIKNKKSEIINIYQNEIIKNKNLLLEEVQNDSLFNSEKIILVDQIDDKVLENITDVAKIIKNEKIFLFSDILEKKSKLRSYFEKSKTLGIVPCYKDNELTIKNIITKQLKGYYGLNSQIINLIIQNTGLDRNKINNEIGKIKSYCLDKKIIHENIDLLLNIRTNEDFNILKDEALKGNKINTNRLLSDTVFEPENNIYYLNIINQRFYKLNEIENKKKNNNNIEDIISNIKPPIFWKDKPVIIEQAKKWNKNKISKALKKTYDTELVLKSNASTNKELLIKNLIVDLCTAANSS